MKKTAIALTLILTSLTLLAAGTLFANPSSANFFPDPGPDLPRIYIRNDGSVEPATAPIERTGNLYKLTDNIVLYTIEIQRDNVILDGAGYTIQGNASRIKGYDEGNNGVIVAGRNNVTITRLNFEQGDTGVRISGSSNIISDNKIEILLPIIMDNADSNIIARNEISGPSSSLTHWPDRDQNFTGNEGISLFIHCSNNIISQNNITGFVNQAIRIVEGSNNTVYGNYFANNQFAIALGGLGRSVNNTFYGNTFAADSCKIQINEADGTFWDNGTMGNYWGDYNGTDSNGDGIGDTPYTVKGYKWDTDVDGFMSFVSGQDNYPLMAPFEVPSSSPDPQLNSEPFPTAVVATASGVSATVLVVGPLFYFKKRKH